MIGEYSFVDISGSVGFNHVGCFRYYDAYLNYFSEYLRDHTSNDAFKHFVMSTSFNFDPNLVANDAKDIKNVAKEGKKHPEMLNRALGGLLHPYIHLMYGLEFGLPGQVAEGSSLFAFDVLDPDD